MNFLAHFLLTPDDEELLAGQMLGDFLVRGWRERASPRTVSGVELHQAIDAYTDRHPIGMAARNRFPKTYRRYAGIILDVFYDHFLARDFERYSDGEPLDLFSARCYRALQSQRGTAPPRMQRAVDSMTRHDWLGAYASIDGVRGALRGISRRLRRENPLAEAAELLPQMDRALEADFRAFFPQLQEFAQETYRNLKLVRPIK